MQKSGSASAGRRVPDDYGFSTQVGARGARLIRRDGMFNVDRKGLSFLQSLSIYHALINMSWKAFYAMVLAVFLGANAGFSLIYLGLGFTHLRGAEDGAAWQRFASAFFFSTQTLTTVGYGHVYPVGFWTNAVASLESMLGLLAFAVATGLLFARFSRPHAKILFSRQALIAPYAEGRAFMFRIANAHRYPLIEPEVYVGYSGVAGRGAAAERRFQELRLERSRITFFPLSWTVVHPIDADSPLVGISAHDLQNSDAEFFVQVKAYDDGFHQTVHARFSYKAGEIVWGGKFASIFSRGEDGATVLDLGRLSEYAAADLPSPVPHPQD